MNKKERNIENVLNSLDGIERATPGDFFYTRVSARLLDRKPSIWETVSSYIVRPTIVITGLCFIVMINIMAILLKTADTNTATESAEFSLVEEYSMASANYYDYENGEAQ